MGARGSNTRVFLISQPPPPDGLKPAGRHRLE